MRTAQEWWKEVDSRWEDLMEIIYAYAPCQIERAISCKRQKSPQLARVLNMIWHRAPDNRSVLYSFAGWGVLCDLCSEEWVLYDDDERVG